MIDYIESKEACAEKEYVDMLQKDGRLKCACGNIFDEDDGEVLSADPWGMPSCPVCCDEYFSKFKVGE